MKNRKNGFTLIETIFALLVAALIITPLIRLLMRTVEVVGMQEERLLDEITLQRFLYESRLHAGNADSFERQETLDSKKMIFFIRSSLSEKSEFTTPFLFKERVFIKNKTSKKEFDRELISFNAIFPQAKTKEEKTENEKR